MSDTRQLAVLMERKHDCLRTLRDLGLRQLEMIAAGDMSMLMKLLSAKQQLLNELNSVERELDPFRNETPEERVWHSNTARENCAQLTSRCQLLFSEIVTQERDSESQLVLQRDDAERRLRGMHTAAHAQGAYLSDSLVVGSLDLSTDY